MSILISNSELATFVSGIRDHFDSFAQFHQLIVIKEPIKTIININGQNEYAGYGNESNVINYNLTPVSGIFSCMTYTPESWKDEGFDPIPTFLLKGDMLIKIEQIPMNYIENGKNTLIILDNETFNIVGGPLLKNYGTQLYYYYSLERTI